MAPETASAIDTRIAHAFKTHGPMDSDALALGALHLELQEVTIEMQARDLARTYEELLDVATVAIRRAQAIAALSIVGTAQYTNTEA